MKTIQLLDCTLRDGGYINNWEFGFENIKKIVQNLENSNIDYIECGFLKSIQYKKNNSLFNKIQKFIEILPNEKNKIKFCLMINYGDIDFEEIETNKRKDVFLRLSFKKENLENALEFAEKIKNKNYEIIISPMHTYSYTEKELKKLIKEINKIKPKAVSIVDTTGAMQNDDVIKTFRIIDSILKKEISICFHSHNNLNLSYSNAKCLINEISSRNLIIDCSLLGIGRGAGNLAIEKIAKDLSNNYNIDLLNKTIETFIKPIFKKSPWGINTPYSLSAKYKLHPYYAKFLIEKELNKEKIEEIFKLIPKEKKENFDVNLIKKLYNKINS